LDLNWSQSLKHDVPPQIQDVCGVIKKSIQNGDFRFSKHAILRGLERVLSLKDALYVLKRGFHNKKKTSFDEKRRTWKYAIEGKTTDYISARVIVAFESGMVVITVIRLVDRKIRRK
jgi:hypothetical protein